MAARKLDKKVKVTVVCAELPERENACKGEEELLTHLVEVI